MRRAPHTRQPCPSQTHDANGSLTNDGARKLVWDAFNRLVEVRDAATNVPVVTAKYDSGNRYPAGAGCEASCTLDLRAALSWTASGGSVDGLVPRNRNGLVTVDGWMDKTLIPQTVSLALWYPGAALRTSKHVVAGTGGFLVNATTEIGRSLCSVGGRVIDCLGGEE